MGAALRHMPAPMEQAVQDMVADCRCADSAAQDDLLLLAVEVNDERA
jgi:hypothetical protein